MAADPASVEAIFGVDPAAALSSGQAVQVLSRGQAKDPASVAAAVEALFGGQPADPAEVFRRASDPLFKLESLMSPPGRSRGQTFYSEFFTDTTGTPLIPGDRSPKDILEGLDGDLKTYLRKVILASSTTSATMRGGSRTQGNFTDTGQIIACSILHLVVHPGSRDRVLQFLYQMFCALDMYHDIISGRGHPVPLPTHGTYAMDGQGKYTGFILNYFKTNIPNFNRRGPFDPVMIMLLQLTSDNISHVELVTQYALMATVKIIGGDVRESIGTPLFKFSPEESLPTLLAVDVKCPISPQIGDDNKISVQMVDPRLTAGDDAFSSPFHLITDRDSTFGGRSYWGFNIAIGNRTIVYLASIEERPKILIFISNIGETIEVTEEFIRGLLTQIQSVGLDDLYKITSHGHGHFVILSGSISIGIFSLLKGITDKIIKQYFTYYGKLLGDLIHFMALRLYRNPNRVAASGDRGSCIHVLTGGQIMSAVGRTGIKVLDATGAPCTVPGCVMVRAPHGRVPITHSLFRIESPFGSEPAFNSVSGEGDAGSRIEDIIIDDGEDEDEDEDGEAAASAASASASGSGGIAVAAANEEDEEDEEDEDGEAAASAASASASGGTAVAAAGAGASAAADDDVKEIMQETEDLEKEEDKQKEDRRILLTNPKLDKIINLSNALRIGDLAEEHRITANELLQQLISGASGNTRQFLQQYEAIMFIFRQSSRKPVREPSSKRSKMGPLTSRKTRRSKHKKQNRKTRRNSRKH